MVGSLEQAGDSWRLRRILFGDGSKSGSLGCLDSEWSVKIALGVNLKVLRLLV